MSVASFTRPRRLVGLGRLLFKEKISGSNPLGVTKKEIEDSQGGALATPPPVASALNAKSKFAESRRKKE